MLINYNFGKIIQRIINDLFILSITISSSSLLKNIYLKNTLRALNGSNESSESRSETSNPGRPRLAIHEEDPSNKRCLSVDERIRRSRLCYSSSR